MVGPPLVEREEELALLDEWIADSAKGHGRTVVVEGPAGIGKTSLLEVVRGRAEDRRMVVVAAHGAVLERDFGFGVVRQLFEPVVARAPARERRQLLAGAAGLAAPVMSGGSAEPVDQPAVI